MGKGGQTIGYHYLFSLLFGGPRGPCNELAQIKVGDKIAWTGPLCGDGIDAIDAPELFGGEKKEGGIQGPFRVFRGAADQVLPGAESISVGIKGPMSGTRSLPSVKTTIGGLLSEFRGVSTLWFDGLISSMNPYPKDWKMRWRRYSAGWYGGTAWYPEKSAIFMADGEIHAMNPAHIIYECKTNPEWGEGRPTSALDENSFIAAANQLCSEQFGLCFAWARDEEIGQFIDRIIQHIDAAFYEDPATGKWVLKLIRNDYVFADLPVFAFGGGLRDIEDDDSSSFDTMFTEIVGTGHDPITDEDFQVRVQNLAARHSQNGTNSKSESYIGIPTRELMARVLQRDIRKFAAGLKKFALVLDRTGHKLRPGMPFRIQAPSRGIADMVVRAVEIEDDDFRDGRIRLTVMQDVFGMPETSFVTPGESTWEPPATDAEPAAAELLLEAGYRDVYLRTTASDRSTIDDADAFIGVVATGPNSTSYEYDLATRVSGAPAFTVAGTRPFTGSATLVADIAALDTAFSITGASGFGEDVEGQAIMIEGADGLHECMQLVSYDEVTGAVTVTRGVADTIPAAHSAGARLWTIDDDLASDNQVYAESEIVEAKVLTRTASDLLPEADAATLSVTLAGRFGCPYPPGNFQIDATSVFALSGVYPEPVLTWTHRDRLLQADQLVAHGDGSVGPEAGTTYNVRILNPLDESVIRAVTGLSVTTWTYDAAMQATDGEPSTVLIELESERDGLTSWQKYRVPLTLNDVLVIDGDPVLIDGDTVEF